MFQSLKGRLILLTVLIGVAGFAAGGVMVGLFHQSAAAQAAEAGAQIARACDAIAASLDTPALQQRLTAVIQTALRDRPGIEGGIWQADVGSLGYAYPTYQGAEPKLDLPAAEVSRIRAVNAVASNEDRQAFARYDGTREVLLLSACPLRGSLPKRTAWTMTRVVTYAGSAYRQLMVGLGILLLTVVAAAGVLFRLTYVWAGHVRRIETALAPNDVARLPQIPLTGETELDRIIGALNLAGKRLDEASERADRLGEQVAAGERLAALGRVAAGVAHEIRNPIAAMRLKAENALLGDAQRKEQALSMMLGQIERLDRLLKRLLSLTERDPPQRRPTDVNALLETCAREHDEFALAHGVTIENLGANGSAFVDHDQMRRALDNLVVNAIQASPEGTHVRIAARRDGDALILSVHDEGGGPPEAIAGHVFEPFVTGRPDGTGLGLSVVREIANAHGGVAKILVDQTGTTVEINVPWL